MQNYNPDNASATAINSNIEKYDIDINTYHLIIS